ncbi:MAG: MBL fold metallo-hydrolase [Cytophagales bacterium]|nr:MBL fold metallo-hydrolase [Rhizobacter sp.]
MTFATTLRRSLAALGSALLLAASAQAAAPQVKTQAPGYYRMMLGDIEVTALLDGILPLEPHKLLTNTTPAEVSALLKRSFHGDAVPTSVNAYLINTGSKLVLVDAGAAKLFGPGLDQLHANLKAAGYQPEQVDAVVITHMHGDHVGGLIQEGRIAFPNATVYADKHDADFWLSAESLEKAPKEMKAFFQGAQLSLNPYVIASKFKAFEGDTEIVPGVKAIAAHGHTPGHTIYAVESQGQKLVLWGDLMHVAAVQFPKPAVTIQFDSDSKAAAAQRKKAFADAAKGGYWVASAHLPFPGIGHLRVDGKGYTFVPMNYGPVR